MTIIRSWTERYEPAPTKGWHDCVFCAYLAALEAAGLPQLAGVDRIAEREALERSQHIWAPETGADLAAGQVAVQNRYHVTPHSSSDLRGLLAIPGLAIVAAGMNSRLPTRLHHWDRAYQGSHAVTFITRQGDWQLILDPEAPDKYAGDAISTAEAVRWWDTKPVRYWRLDELGGAMRTVTITEWPEPRRWSVAPGGHVDGYALATVAPVRSHTWSDAAGSGASADALVRVDGVMVGAIPAGKYYRVIDGYFAGLYVPTNQVTLQPAPADPLRDAAQDAVDRLQAALG